MEIKDIKNQDTTHGNIHESVYRCYHVLEKVRYWLQKKVPAEMILEYIEECYSE